MNLHRLLPVAATAGVLGSALLAGPAHAASVEHFAMDSYEPVVVATCGDGHEIENHLTDGHGTFMARSGPDGSPVYQLNLKYTMQYTDLRTGETYAATGTRHLTMDGSGYTVDSGNHRSLSVPGDGWVLKMAGRKVFGPDEEVVWNAGPAVNDTDVANVCAIFGLEPAS